MINCFSSLHFSYSLPKHQLFGIAPSSTDFWRILKSHDLKKSFLHKIRFVFWWISSTIQLVLFCHKASKTQSYTNKNNDWVFCSANQLKIEPQNSVISNPRRGEKSGCSRAVPDFSPAKRDRNDTWFFYVLSTFDFM